LTALAKLIKFSFVFLDFQMLKKFFIAGVALAFSNIAFSAVLSSANHTTSTTFTPGSSFNSFSGCGVSSPTSARSYGTATFTTQSAGSYSFQVTGSTKIDDPFMAVYLGSFNPNSPADNLVGCNDDGGQSPNSLFSVFTADLLANTAYVAVVTNYAGGVSDGTISFNIGKNPEIALSNTTLDIGAANPSMTATSDSPISITYQSSNTSVATIDANTGALTLVGAGTTTITASQAAQADPLLFRAGTKTATLTVTAPVNGACGTSAGQALAYVPSTNLCSAGTASLVTSSNAQYTWTCSGTGSGTNASCTAPWATNAGAGSGSLTASNNNGWTVSSASFTATPTATQTAALPRGVALTNGLLDLTLTTGTSGSDATVVVQYTTAVPTGAVYMKYGKTAARPTDHWYQLDTSRAVFAADRMSVTLTLTDGGVGDNDLQADGTIVDPGGPALVTPDPIPTLSEWAMIFLASLMGMFAFARIRRQS
jgi:hypothetical protein